MSAPAERLLAQLREERVQLSVEAARLRVRSPRRISNDVRNSILTNRAALLAYEKAAEPIGTPPSHQRFSWVQTPYGPAKIWGFLKGDRVGVVPRGYRQVAWIRRDEMSLYWPEPDRANEVSSG